MRSTRIASLAILGGMYAKIMTEMAFPKTESGPRGIKVTAAITEKEVLAAQKVWGDALLEISARYEKEGFEAARALAETVIDTAYGYKYGPVLFKPTMAGGKQTFRNTKEGALSYFVGGDSTYPNDHGFGIKGWRKYKFVNAAIWRQGKYAMVQGNAIFTDKNGDVTIVDKSFGYFKGPDGKVVIVLHHSSLPYTLPKAGAAKSASPMTDEDVLAAQKLWGDALVEISKTYEEKGWEAARDLAETVIDTAYGYMYGPVLFKPTMAGGKQTFRPTARGALSYFVGGDSKYPNDHGFGIKGWRKYKFVNYAIWKEGSYAMVQGNAIFTDKDGGVTTVDKTFGYFKGPDGKVVIVLHHSSLPYSA